MEHRHIKISIPIPNTVCIITQTIVAYTCQLVLIMFVYIHYVPRQCCPEYVVRMSPYTAASDSTHPGHSVPLAIGEEAVWMTNYWAVDQLPDEYWTVDQLTDESWTDNTYYTQSLLEIFPGVEGSQSISP